MYLVQEKYFGWNRQTLTRGMGQKHKIWQGEIQVRCIRELLLSAKDVHMCVQKFYVVMSWVWPSPLLDANTNTFDFIVNAMISIFSRCSIRPTEYGVYEFS